ncbi:hypothetical protein CF319_g3776 [Tilletia indica]|nr:hypothetical protein CF319_g3776 [Tilletia indica]
MPRPTTLRMARGSATSATCNDLGGMHIPCPKCRALHWIAERSDGSVTTPIFGSCCAKGKVILPNIFDAPQSLRALFCGEGELALRFQDNTRPYNNAFAFTSLGVKRDMTVAGQMGIYTFKIQGQLCHKMGSLLPPDGFTPAFAQVYFVETDPNSASGVRLDQARQPLDSGTVDVLERMLHQVNPYARLLQHARPLLEELQTPETDVGIKLLQPGRDTGNDPRTYNRPSVSEVAALIVTPSGTPFDIASRDIVIRYRAGEIRRISHLHAAFLPLRFPVLIPYGHFGWHDAIPLGADSPRTLFSADPTLAAAALEDPNVVRGRGRGGSVHVSLDQFHAFHLHIRGHFSTLFRSNSLLQEWIVDAWVVIEQNRASYLHFNQDLLRREVYSGLSDALISGADLNSIGSRTILPSSFTNSPRFWQTRYHDAMSLVRVFGKPDLFVTMTCNPKWTEITRELGPNQIPSDRPDLVTRVFNLKLRYLLDLLLRKHVLGVVAAYVHSVEFQKRGLPHAHILLILADSDKLKTRDDVDAVVSAELPDPELDAELFEVIASTMIHGPCVPGQACMNDPRFPGKCSKGYPVPFRPVTNMDSDGYPDYRRRDLGIVSHRRGAQNSVWTADNTWVVPHNPFLSKTLSCHLNVEVCSSIAAVKYLYKYVFKGPDHISMQSGTAGTNEIDNYLNARYVSPCEEIARLANEKTLSDFGIPPPDDAFSCDTFIIPSAVAREQQWDPTQQAELAINRFGRMNDEQKFVFTAITQAVDASQPAMFFLQGSGGCGKTFVMNAILSHVRGQSHIAIAVASSGIASIMLEGGRTAHFRFKLPLALDANTNCSIKAQSDSAEVFRRMRLIVWDEAPMQTRYAFEAVDRMLRDIRRDIRPFGGCTVLMSGDWKQTLPVVRRASEAQVVFVCLHKSYLWNSVAQLQLHTNVRLLQTVGVHRENQQQYADWILSIGHGQDNTDDGTVAILPQLRMYADSIQRLCDFVYDDLISSREPRPLYYRRRAILHSRNADVDVTNNHVLERLPGEPYHFYAADRALDIGGEQDHAFTPEYLASLAPSGIPPFKLSLKLNCVVMLIRNLDPSDE